MNQSFLFVSFLLKEKEEKKLAKREEYLMFCWKVFKSWFRIKNVADNFELCSWKVWFWNDSSEFQSLLSFFKIGFYAFKNSVRHSEELFETGLGIVWKNDSDSDPQWYPKTHVWFRFQGLVCILSRFGFFLISDHFFHFLVESSDDLSETSSKVLELSEILTFRRNFQLGSFCLLKFHSPTVPTLLHFPIFAPLSEKWQNFNLNNRIEKLFSLQMCVTTEHFVHHEKSKKRLFKTLESESESESFFSFFHTIPSPAFGV